jgi:uncharacterized C2H2 Zn-finger protein
MIEIRIDLAVALYLGLSIVILVIWIFFEKRKTAADKEGKTENIWKCPVCFYVYVDSRSDRISKCPKCKTLHKKEETS